MLWVVALKTQMTDEQHVRGMVPSSKGTQVIEADEVGYDDESYTFTYTQNGEKKLAASFPRENVMFVADKGKVATV